MKPIFACQKCRRAHEGEPFTTWSGGGVTIKANSTNLCLACAGDIAYGEALQMAAQGRKYERVKE